MLVVYAAQLLFDRARLGGSLCCRKLSKMLNIELHPSQDILFSPQQELLKQLCWGYGASTYSMMLFILYFVFWISDIHDY